MTLKIVVACILKDCQGRVLITQRPAGKFMAGFWEFPGGKIEEGETPEEALIREMKEELGINLKREDLMPFSFISYPYETFHLVMPIYQVCNWTGEPQGCEGQNFMWCFPKELKNIQVLPADLSLIERLSFFEKFVIKGGSSLK